jgi:SAM-dependent methyltransferase
VWPGDGRKLTMDARLYEEHALLERDHWWFVGRRDILRTVLARHLPPRESRRILDVGCGTGGMLPMLADFGTVEGLEGEPAAVQHCHTAYSSFPVRLGSIPADVPADGAFDVASAFDVIEHLDDDVSALSAMRSAVRPGGTIVVTVPALQWLWSDHDRVNGHRRRYSRSTLVAALRSAKLQVVHLSYFNTLLLPIVAASRLIERLRRAQAEPQSDFSMPRHSVNRALTRTFRLERSVAARAGWPIGVSLVAIAGRADDEREDVR